MPARKYKTRYEYLKASIPKGFHKKILKWKGKVVGTIEYTRVQELGLPIKGAGIHIMNCIWVLRRAKGKNFGKILLNHMIRSLKRSNANGLATIALENHPTPWLKRFQIERLGFKSIAVIKLKYLVRRQGHIFKVYLMWLPIKKGARKPTWEIKKILKGVTFCLAHPLYHPQHIKSNNIFEKVR
jgi:GNAT superfamily N-acetyltransferase